MNYNVDANHASGTLQSIANGSSFLRGFQICHRILVRQNNFQTIGLLRCTEEEMPSPFIRFGSSGQAGLFTRLHHPVALKYHIKSTSL